MTCELDALARRIPQQILEASPYAALEDIYQHRKHVFPIDRIYGVRFDADRCLMRVLAEASDLVDHVIEQKSRELKYRKQPTLVPDAIARLKNYSWPGNVRELENVVERELILRINPSTLRNRMKKLGI